MTRFNDKEIQELLKQDSETLCATIVIDRIFKCYKQAAKQCMIELMVRRQNGENFDFEKIINENSEKYAIKLNIPDIAKFKKDIFSSIISEYIKVKLFNIPDD